MAHNLLKRVYVVGVGMTKFTKPGTGADYPEMAHQAVQSALSDARVGFQEVEQACVGYVYGDSTCGQRAIYSSGMTGIPIYNVNNNCATGASALHLAKQLVSGSQAQCVLALGFEKMERGSLGVSFPDKTNPMDKHIEAMSNIAGISTAPLAAQMFGNAGAEHMKRYGTKVEHFAKVAMKNHNNGTRNPNSQFRVARSMEEILSSPQIVPPLTKFMCCPTSDGAAAALVASEEFVKKHNLQNSAVEILAMEMATDLPTTFSENSMFKVIGYDMSKTAAERAFQKSGRKVSEVNVVELHDCFAANELITYEALGLCPEGKAGEFIDRGDNTYGGKFVVNPSGGLISKGHPLGATGLAQCAELCWQLRGLAGDRQVPSAKLALQHNLGLGGAVVVALYQLGFPPGAGAASTQGGSTAGQRNIHTSAGSMTVPEEKQAEDGAAATGGADGAGFKCAPVFQMLKSVLQTDGAELVKKINGIYGFNVSDGPEGKTALWVVDVKNGNGNIEFNGKATPDVVLSLNDMDLLDLMTGKLNAQKAFFQGKLKIKGNMGLALKLREFQTQIAKATTAKL